METDAILTWHYILKCLVTTIRVPNFMLVSKSAQLKFLAKPPD